MDANGMPTSWNWGAQRLFGYGADEMFGRTGDLIFIPEDEAEAASEKERSEARAGPGLGRRLDWFMDQCLADTPIDSVTVNSFPDER
jgi:PAS domain S-box-containing protein